MKLFICDDNKHNPESLDAADADVRVALEQVNGRATSHTFTHRSDIDNEITKALRFSLPNDLPKTVLNGLTLTLESGEKMPSAYAKKGRYVVRTRVTVKCIKGIWYMIGAEKFEAFSDSKPQNKVVSVSKSGREWLVKYYDTQALTAAVTREHYSKMGN
jgi:hypothetical protein